MKLIMDNGNEYELVEIQNSEFVYFSVSPNEDFVHIPQIENITDGGIQPFKYKSIKINLKFYLPKFTDY
jgi:hypothetical protein